MTDLAGSRTAGGGQAAARMADLVPQGRADVTGVISSVRAMSIASTPACRYTLTDGTGELDLLFIGRVEIAGMECGRRCRAVGTVSRRDHRLVLWNPRYWLEPTDSKPPDVLVVDNDKAVRRVLEVSLAARGYQVDVAATGAAAIELARREPGFVILDIGLPDMSGLAAISAIRAECDAPIIAISSQEAVATRSAALAAGASDYLSKPFAMDTLLAKVG
jgi:CheY-like chemotaxis protein